MNIKSSLVSILKTQCITQDTLCTQGLLTTAGSHVLEGYKPPYDATCVMKLKAAGASILGKANCDQFAMGSTTESSSFQVYSPRLWFCEGLHSISIIRLIGVEDFADFAFSTTIHNASTKIVKLCCILVSAQNSQYCKTHS